MTTTYSPTIKWLALAGIGLIAVSVLIVKYRDWFSPPPETKLEGDPGTSIQRGQGQVPRVRFTDVTAAAGIHFHHANGMTENKLLPETMGSGVGVIDFDGDGYPDLLFINSRPWPGREKPGEPLPTLALYGNQKDGTFKDVTKEAGLAVSMYGMGVTVGDYDNDGLPDLFVTGVGGNRLFHNQKVEGGANGHRFREVTSEAGVGGPGGWPTDSKDDFFQRKEPLCFSSSAAFLDYDGDGQLDLFVCNYVTWSPARDLAIGFKLDGSERRYGQPTLFEGATCFLYRNRGKGKFEDVSRQTGVQVFEKEGIGEKAGDRPVGKSLGVIVCDADGDSWPDVVVANDTVRNFFFHNQAGPDNTRAFKEVGLPTGVAFAEGKARGAMGIDWAPGYRPGCNALLIGNFSDEPDTFLCQDDLRHLQFNDMAMAEGIWGPSRLPLKFGVFFFDFDLDGRLDFLTNNGHLDPGIGRIQTGQTYEQPPQLFWNTGERFEPVTAETSGADLSRPLVGRGCAYLDFDRDGDPDVVLMGNGGPARLLRNDNQLGNHWIRLRLEGDGKHSNRSAIGARVILETSQGEQRREVTASRGFLSQSELAVSFGLGKQAKVDRITIHWPGRDPGSDAILEKPAVDKEHVVKQGKN